MPMKNILIAFVLTTFFAVTIRAADVTNTPSFFAAAPLVEALEVPLSATNAVETGNRGNGEPEKVAPTRRHAGSPFQSSFPRRDYITITNGVLWPVPTGAAFVDVTAPTELRVADFPEGVVLTLAIRNPANHAVYLAFNPTNTFLLTDQLGVTPAGRYLLHIQNVRGEIWITK